MTYIYEIVTEFMFVWDIVISLHSGVCSLNYRNNRLGLFQMCLVIIPISLRQLTFNEQWIGTCLG